MVGKMRRAVAVAERPSQHRLYRIGHIIYCASYYAGSKCRKQLQLCAGRAIHRTVEGRLKARGHPISGVRFDEEPRPAEDLGMHQDSAIRARGDGTPAAEHAGMIDLKTVMRAFTLDRVPRVRSVNAGGQAQQLGGRGRSTR